jgi:4-alpha-glucanotransferase
MVVKVFDQKSDFLLACKQDPVLSTIKLIAEPWDIGPGGYALGQFPKGWTEWNDRFRDDVRSFWRGDSMAHKALAGRLLGSADHFDHSEKSAQSSVNFVTSHDGFTLKDVVSYNEKHNHANGEENRDGHGHNLSENMGVEGPSDDSEIIAARHRRSRNLLATLMLSQGTPMLLAGDEFGHSQGGNNNTYCQDNEITWLDWGGSDDALKDFTADLIALRKSKPHFSQEDFLHGQTLDNITAKNAIWLSPHGGELHGGAWDDHALTCLGLVLNLETDGGVLIIFNRGEAQRFAALTEKSWTFELSTAGPFQDDIIPAHCISVFSLAHTYQTPEQELANLKKKTEAYNFISEFRDISGQTHQADPITLRKLINALETTPPQPYPKIDIKTQIFGVEILRKWGGVWGVTCGLYGLRSERSWGIGDFEDLAVLAEHMAEKGADFIGLNPVHALFPSAPHLYSPYSPSSREFLNVMHIAPDKIPELLDAKRPASFDSGDDNLVDYADVYRHKRKAFEQAFLSFQALSKSHSRVVAFHEFCDSKGEALSQHALFDVIFEALPKSQQNYDGYYNFAKEFQEPINRACQKFESQNTDRILYYKYLQWIAHIQLAEAQRRAESAGMRVGLYLDFAVGVVPGGSDAWRYQTAFARGVSLGAPGDMANPDGQKWDLLPFNPHALIKQKFVPLQRALKANMEIGGALRIDHVLGMQRSFLIPEHGGAGAYLRFPFEALLKLISDLSNETSCVIFGEDLGTVPDDFRRQMAEWKLMGCSILLIERTSSGDIIPLDDLREMAVTAFSNHDFPTLSGFWAGDDFVWRESLGIGSDPNVLAHEKQAREQDKNVLSDVSNLNGKPEYLNSQAMAKLQSWLATAPSLAFAVPLEDIMLDRQQPNVPGTTDEQPNWRRRSKLSLETLKTDVSCNEILDTLAAARPRRP